MTQTGSSRSSHARARRALAAIGATLLLCAVAICWTSLARARSAAGRAQNDYTLASADAQRVLSLRARTTRVTDRPPPEPDLVARLQATLRDAGIAESRLASVSTSRPEPIRDTPFRRVLAPLTVEGVRAAEVARFVAAWTEEAGAWTITALTLTHEPSGRRGDSGGVDLYTARFTLENIHVDALAVQDPEARP